MHHARRFPSSGRTAQPGAGGIEGKMRLALFCCSLLAVGPAAAAATLPAPADLALEGAGARGEGKPLILFFSFPGCQFCHVVRQNYLSPLLRTGKVGQRPVIRELDITSTQKVGGFDGAPGTQQAIARQYGIRVAPTVLFVDAHGKLLAEPIVGGDVSGLYGGYLDNAFSEAQKRLSAAAAMHGTRGNQ
jgi:hypothetical protein